MRKSPRPNSTWVRRNNLSVCSHSAGSNPSCRDTLTRKSMALSVNWTADCWKDFTCRKKTNCWNTRKRGCHSAWTLHEPRFSRLNLTNRLELNTLIMRNLARPAKVKARVVQEAVKMKAKVSRAVTTSKYKIKLAKTKVKQHKPTRANCWWHKTKPRNRKKLKTLWTVMS